MRSRIFHKIWSIIFVSPGKLKERKRKKCSNGKAKVVTEEEEEVRGDCDDPSARNKQIRIANNLPPIEQLEVVIHECLHASDWFKDEEWIEEVAVDIARLLWKLGWRLAKDGNLTRKKSKEG